MDNKNFTINRKTGGKPAVKKRWRRNIHNNLTSVLHVLYYRRNIHEKHLLMVLSLGGVFLFILKLFS